MRSVVRNRRLSRALRGVLAVGVTEHGGWLLILLYAFDRGGVGEVGWVAAALLAPAAVGAPLLAVAADRFRRDRVLTFGFAAIGISLGATGVAMLTDAPPLVVYGCALLHSVLLTVADPAVSAVLPSVAKSADELTAANVTVGFVQTVGQLLGPALAGAMLAVTTTGTAIVVLAAIMVVGAVATVDAVPNVAELGHADDPPAGSAFAELVGGVRLFARDRRIRAVTVAIGTTALAIGAIDVGAAAIAVEVLGRGEAVTGALVTALGLGGLLGASASLWLVGRQRLARALGAGVVTMSVAAALLGWSPSLSTTLPLLVVVGAAVTLTSVAGRTMLQGLTPDDTLARLFGVLEALEVGALAVGGIVLSLVAVHVGIAEAFAVVGGFTTLAVFAQARTLAQIDAARRPVDPELLALARSSAVFGPLPPYAIEQIMAELRPQTLAPHEVLLRRGDRGDRVFIVAAGEVLVDVAGTEPVVKDRGAHIGELAILHDAPRNADVRAGADGAELFWMTGAEFVDAIDQVPRSRARVEAEASRRSAQ